MLKAVIKLSRSGAESRGRTLEIEREDIECTNEFMFDFSKTEHDNGLCVSMSKWQARQLRNALNFLLGEDK